MLLQSMSILQPQNMNHNASVVISQKSQIIIGSDAEL